MDYYIYNIDEYQPLEQGNKFAPTCPFRMGVSGSSDSGKTTMVMNLLMGDKKMKEDGERYIPCNDVVLVGKHLDEPKWNMVRDFYNSLAEEGEDVSFKVLPATDIPDIEEFDPSRSTVVIFEDLMNASRKIQERIAEYFSSGRHRNISPIYISQRFFAIPKTIRENVSYISLHRGGGSLADIKRIISQYTEHSESLAPIIDDLTRKREFIVFDLGRSKIDPLSIRVRWDTSIQTILDDPSSILDDPSSILDDPSSISDHSSLILDDSSIHLGSSKFSSYGQNILAEAKKDKSLLDFARNMPSPKERKKMLASGVNAKNSDVWARYVYREAFCIKGKDLGPGWAKFENQLASLKRSNGAKSPITKETQLKCYKELLASCPLDDKKMLEGLEILLWLIRNGHIDRKIYMSGVKEILG